MAAANDREGYIGRIPIRSLWLLMLYASELYRTRGIGAVDREDNPEELPDLVAKILTESVVRRQRRNLSRSYRPRQAVLNRVRGCIDVLTTERRQLLSRGLVACHFDELTVDTPRNRFVRAALESICRLVHNADLRHRCRSLAAGLKMQGVSGDAPSRTEMSVDRIGRHDYEDRQMIAAAQLAFDLALPTETSGSNVLPLPEREEAWVRRLFERAVGGFYDAVLSPRGWHVYRGGKLDWQITGRTSGIHQILPTMRTDVVLDHAESGRRIVMDTKFTSIMTRGWYRDESLRSGYVYQIYAYLRSQVGGGDALADTACGVLLHPSVGEEVDQTAIIQGHNVRFATLDLTASSAVIRARLLQMCEPDLARVA